MLISSRKDIKNEDLKGRKNLILSERPTIPHFFIFSFTFVISFFLIFQTFKRYIKYIIYMLPFDVARRREDISSAVTICSN